MQQTMTLPRYRVLARHWCGTPPVAESIAGVLRGLGVPLEVPPADDPVTGEPVVEQYTTEEAMALFAQAGFTVG